MSPINRMTTEMALLNWRHGQPLAERLAAQLLHLEGHSQIEPQHPLGGPDGKKDVLYSRESERWLAAVFFPTTLSLFGEVRAKFEDDLSGVAKNGCAGIGFFTNQHLTISQRAELIKLASPLGAEVYESERICRLLDSPRGCGIRLQYLEIAMTDEEQWAFWQVMNTDLAQQIARSTSQLERIERKLDLVFRRTNNLLFDATAEPPSMTRQQAVVFFATSLLNTQLLCWIHRMATDGSTMPEEARGRLRTIDVWLSKVGSPYASANWHPPAPDSLEQALDSLFQWWRNEYRALITKTRDEVVVALAARYRVLMEVSIL